MKGLILDGATTGEIGQAARTAGLRPLAWAGLRAMLAGETSADEVLRAAPRPV